MGDLHVGLGLQHVVEDTLKGLANDVAVYCILELSESAPHAHSGATVAAGRCRPPAGQATASSTAATRAPAISPGDIDPATPGRRR